MQAVTDHADEIIPRVGEAGAEPAHRERRADHDRQPQVADRLFEPLAAHALRQHAEGRQRRATGNEDRLAVLTLGRSERERLALPVLVEGLGVDRRGPLLRLVRLHRTRRLVAPRLLPVELARLAGTRLERRGSSAALQRSAVRDVTCDERVVVRS